MLYHREYSPQEPPGPSDCGAATAAAQLSSAQRKKKRKETGASPRGWRSGGGWRCCLGIQLAACITSHRTVPDSASCRRSIVLAHRAPRATPDKFPLRGLDLVNNPSGLIEASVCYMCIDLSCPRCLNEVFLSRSRSCAAPSDAPVSVRGGGFRGKPQLKSC